MATTSVSPANGHDHPNRRRPFSSWVKKFAKLKHGSSSSTRAQNGTAKNGDTAVKASKKHRVKNNPYPQSGRASYQPAAPIHQSDPSLFTGRTGRTSPSVRSSADGAAPQNAGATSILTDQDASHSIHAPSHMASSVAGTSRTANGGIDSRKGGDSTFSSPAPSVRSLTTTLTTIQSLGPNGAMNAHVNQGHTSNQSNTQTIQFSQPFPTASPASAIPPHLAPHGGGPGHPTTYNQATANNLLTDNASILTLASSSKRRRRRSMDTDTNASVRALAPSSLWGGSRESLPLSVLSANIEAGGGGSSAANPGVLHQSTPSSRMASGANVEWGSIYSTGTGGAAPALQSERNSYYAGKQNMASGDGASVRSGLLGHGRAESINGSIVGMGVNSPLSSPREEVEQERVTLDAGPSKDENTNSLAENKDDNEKPKD